MKSVRFLTVLVLCCMWQVSPGQELYPALETTPVAVVQEDEDSVYHLNEPLQIDSLTYQEIEGTGMVSADTTQVKRKWWREMKHGKVNFDDETMGYPKFLKFCWKLYKWGDRAFNSYDCSYVTSTGKNWKLFMKSNNWMDTYVGKHSDNIKMVMNSNLVSNIGVNLSFMAVSLGYSVSISNLLSSGKVSKKADFSFTCARFTADAYYIENNNKLNVYYTDKSVSNERQKFKQSGVSRKALALTAYYFFNNRRYAQAAAYCFSKYQKRSAGSWLAGLSIQHYDVKFDVEQMSEAAREYIHTQDDAPRILYNDYCVLFGYAHNWVLGRKWLLNITLTPYLGYRYNIKPRDGENASALSLNLRGRFGVVYNHRQFFLGIQGYADHHRYKTSDTHLYNSIIDMSILCGVRF